MNDQNQPNTSLDLAELRRMSEIRGKRWANGAVFTLDFSMMELAGETGEACNAAKKIARHRLGVVGGDPDITKLEEELADVVICADLAAQKAGIDLGGAVVRKFNATSEKHGFPERL